MQQVLIIARGFDLTKASRPQVASMRSCVERLAQDPRVKSIHGYTGHSTGIAILTEVHNWQEADRIASLTRVYGLTDIEVFPLVSNDHLRTGLEEAERIAFTPLDSLKMPVPSPS
jgi:hypothetical protein